MSKSVPTSSNHSGIEATWPKERFEARQLEWKPSYEVLAAKSGNKNLSIKIGEKLYPLVYRKDENQNRVPVSKTDNFDPEAVKTWLQTGQKWAICYSIRDIQTKQTRRVIALVKPSISALNTVKDFRKEWIQREIRALRAAINASYTSLCTVAEGRGVKWTSETIAELVISVLRNGNQNQAMNECHEKITKDTRAFENARNKYSAEDTVDAASKYFLGVYDLFEYSNVTGLSEEKLSAEKAKTQETLNDCEGKAQNIKDLLEKLKSL